MTNKDVMTDNGIQMIEVFKTNVHLREDAIRLIRYIEKKFDYHANFDLDDCDKILRVKAYGLICSSQIITLLRLYGFQAQVLADEVPALLEA